MIIEMDQLYTVTVLVYSLIIQKILDLDFDQVILNETADSKGLVLSMSYDT